MNGTSFTGGNDWKIFSTGPSNLGGAGLFQIYCQTTTTNLLTGTSAGYVGIGMTNPQNQLHILSPSSGALANLACTAFTSGGGTVAMRMHATGSTNAYGSITDYGTVYTAGALFSGQGYGQITAYKYDGTTAGYFSISTVNAGFALSGYTSSGTLSTSSTGVVSTASDARIKSNIVYISSNATSCIMALKPATFTLNSDPTTVKLGFIAQDVETVIPQAVDGKKYEYEWETVTGPDGSRIPKLDDSGNYIYTDKIRPRGLDDRALIATLVKAFQEQLPIIQSLSSVPFLVGYTSSSGPYALQVNGQIFATSSTVATSDAKFKSNVDDLTDATAIISALRPVTFEWKEHSTHNFPKGQQVGFIAQEVQEVFKNSPHLDAFVKKNSLDGEEFLGLAEGHLVPVLVAALKETNAKLETAQNDIDLLETRLAALESLVRSSIPAPTIDPSMSRSAALLEQAQ
jgi:hypothetical protein